MTVTREQLQEVGARHARASAVALEVQQERAELVRRAIAEGWKQRDIAAAVGISQSRVAQIAAGRDR